MTIIDHCRKDFYDLQEAGVDYFVEQLASSLDCAISTLSMIGHDIDHAKDAARRFRELEFKAIANMAGQRDDEKSYISAAQQNIRDLESLLNDAPIRTAPRDRKDSE